MLSYRHAFHAGNHADVLKHFVLSELARYLGQKDAPFYYMDTHAGAGLYSLDIGYATKLAEYVDGIGRLWERAGDSDDLPAPLADYVKLVREINPDGKLKAYPGSPWIAHQTLREQDRLRLFELHPADAELLHANFRQFPRRVMVKCADGYAGIKALLPPPPRRALVLIDPSYEDKNDYRNVVASLQDSLTRFATGVYVVWYPQLSRLESRQLPQKLMRLGANWLHVSLTVQQAASDGFGMHGSGLFVINPPWMLRKTLAEVMPYLVKVLGRDSGAGFVLESSEK
jgi:23S rRNA (adenine2030-N6)-methyltransferase